MFESLSASLSSAFNSLRGRGRLTEANMREGLAGVRTALLEALTQRAGIKGATPFMLELILVKARKTVN